MSKRWVSIVLVALLAIAAAAAVGIYEYRAGIVRGMEMSGKVPVGPGVWGYPYWGGYFHPFGFVFPLLFFVLIFAFARRAFWWGRFGRGGFGQCGLSKQFEDRHRQGHDSMASGEAPR